MASNNEIQKVVVVCDNCGTGLTAHFDPDGEIRLIWTRRGPACSCRNDELRIMSNDRTVLEDVDM
ncbi:hypothetical protein CP557_08690 [Natrinema ejinorense]|uniref:Uncharacterized protein n=1 Tax=Natrinema ejinorense TaxID=373386 RepID=A0A2A5QUT2_9EURY|nr:hypothetical protein CP557_08690 [Natrinema ejinorense]